MQTNSIFFNIHHAPARRTDDSENRHFVKQNVLKQSPASVALTPRQNTPAMLPGQTIIARITDMNDMITTLRTDDGVEFAARAGVVAGNIGDEVKFEVVQTDNGAALRQILAEKESMQATAHAYISIQSLQDLMAKNDFYDKDLNPVDPKNIAENQALQAQKANEAAARIKRSLHRLSNLDAAILGKLAAMGMNIDKLPAGLMDSITTRLDASVGADGEAIAARVENMVDSIMNLGEQKFARILQNEAPITLENLYAAAHSHGSDEATPLTDAEWQSLQKDVAKFLEANGIKNNQEALELAKYLIEHDLPLNRDNYGKLIFLNDIDGNLDIEALLALAITRAQEGEGIANTVVYDPAYDSDLSGKTLDYQLQMARARLEMSYEAANTLFNAPVALDLELQAGVVEELSQAQEAHLTKTLQMYGTASVENKQTIVDTYKNLHTLNYATYNTYGAIIDTKIDFTLNSAANYIAAEKYDAQATVANLKYGDTFNKIAAQFAPMLKELGFNDSQANIKAAQIITKNNMDLNEENLLAIKTVDAKIEDISKKLTPQIAAMMISEGLKPQNMHVDEVLAHIEKFRAELGENDNENLHRSIMELDRAGDTPAHIRERMMDIYRALNRISRNGGAGVGAAVNADIELTLQNLMDFSQNFKSGRNAMNYAISDDTYYAKHLVTSFISLAKPKPLAEFVEKHSLAEHLEQSVSKIADIAKNADTVAQNLEIERVAQEMKALNDTSINQIKFLQDRGLALSLANFRHLRTYLSNGGKLDEDFAELADDEITAIGEAAQSTDLEGFIGGKTAADMNNELINQAEQFMDNNTDAQRIDAMDILLKRLNFRSDLLNNGNDHSFPMKLNGRLADINMYVLNENLSDDGSAAVHISLKTAAGEVLASLDINNGAVELKLAAESQSAEYFRNNIGFLQGLLSDIGINNININITDINAAKNQLRVSSNLPI